MYTGIFDTHAHYADSAFDADRETLLRSLPSEGVDCVMLAGCSTEDSRACIALAERYPHVWCAVGIHPEQVDALPPDWCEQLCSMAAHEKVCAIGEIGLDYHYEGYDRDLEHTILGIQLRLAKELDLPVILHIRDAMGDALELLRSMRPRGVVHCFSGSAETARELVSLGLYIGIGGVLTYKNARKVVQAVEIIPEDRLVFETDCPYLAPVPYRGKRCDSRMIAAVAERAAEIRHTDAQSLIRIAAENGRRLFDID
ncbi:MAG: TatD family hydrolase [Oscillospiraceae bacterium]|nr:TatD family hydrolase [Oscillospiraceae bacterium]